MKKKLSKTNSSKTYQQFYAHVHSKAHSPRSRETYLRWVERLGEHYQPEGPGLRRLSERQVLDYLIYLRDDQKLAASTVNQALVPIRFLYRDVLERDWRLWSQFVLQRREPLPTVLSRAEVKRVLSCVHEGRFRAVLSLVYHCGLRLSEALQLKPTDIDSQRGVVRVRHGKGDKAREVPICPEMLECLRRFWKHHRNPDWLFPGVGRGWKQSGISQGEAMGRTKKPMSSSALQMAMRVIRANSGIHKRFTVHTLRHSFATHLLEEGVSIRQVSRYLGHSELKSTMVYLHVTELSEEGGRQSQSDLFNTVIAPSLDKRR
jgi:site-specific recombinase XerD